MKKPHDFFSMECEKLNIEILAKDIVTGANKVTEALSRYHMAHEKFTRMLDNEVATS